ncbi:MAG: flavin-dependent oxidoreductase [Pseudomonadota bacterium]
MTVLIAGGGIAGMALGLSLAEIGVPFRIFEAVKTLRPIGVGINLQPHAVRELTEMGLGDALDTIGLKTEEVAYFNAKGQLIWAEPRGTFAGYDWSQYSVNRGLLHMMLYDALRARCGDVVETGEAVADWRDRRGGVTVDLFDRGTGEARGRVKGSVLVGCDGINSRIRQRLYPGDGPAKWGGTIMWRGVTRGPRFRTGRTVAMAGTKDVKFVCYPISDDGPDGSVLNWIADLTMPEDYTWRQPDWRREGMIEEFLPHFADWSFDWLDVPRVITEAEQIYEYPMVDRDPLPWWTQGRATLLGDAAHAMYPIGSNGASQCILDARHLARAIRDHGATPAALEAYEATRREPMNALVLANRGDGPDKILDIVAERAPDGFTSIDDVIPLSERQTYADGYKAVAGMDIAALNAAPPVLGG